MKCKMCKVTVESPSLTRLSYANKKKKNKTFHLTLERTTYEAQRIVKYKRYAILGFHG